MFWYLPCIALVFFSLIQSVNAQTITWTGAGDGVHWSDAANWDLDQIPSEMNDAIVPNGFTTVIDASITVNSIVIEGTSEVDLSSALSINSTFSINSAATLNWEAGTIASGTVINAGTINVIGDFGKSIIGGTTVQNEGIMNWLGTGTLTLNDGTINNSGLIDLQLPSLIQQSGTGGVVNNSGTFRKSVGDGQTTLSLTFNNVDGTIDVQIGTLLNNVELTMDRGTYIIADGSVMRSSALTNLVGIIESEPEGTLELAGSIVVADGTSPVINFSGTGLTIGGIANVTGGGILINENILNITGTSGKGIIGGTTVQNEGTMNWLGNGTVTLNDGIINNNGLIDLQVGSLIQRSGAGGAINNSGTFRKRVGDGQTTLSLPFNNVEGIIDVQAGTLLNNVELTLDRGTYFIADGSVLRSSALTNLVGNIESAPEGTLELAGSIVVAEGTSPTVDFSGDGLTVGGIANVTGGGILINKNILNITSTSGKSIIGGTTVQNEGTMNWLGNGTVTLNDGTINNNGLIDLQVGSLIQRSGTGGAINNSGTFRKSTDDSQTTLSLPFNNVDGIIDVQAGILLNNVELTLDRGTYFIADGSVLRSSALTNLVGIIESEPEGTLELAGSIVVAESTSPTINFSGDGLTVGGIANVTGGGILINENILNITSTSGKSIIGGTTVQNEGTMNWLGNGTVTLNDGIINNNGLIDLQVGSLIQRSGTGGAINNSGTFRKSTDDSQTTLSLPFNNVDGIIDVQAGTLLYNVELTLDRGTYFIADGSVLRSSALTNLVGNIESAPEGTLELAGSIVVAEGTSPTINFSGDGLTVGGIANVTGGGILINENILNITGTSGKGIIGGTTVQNEGTMNWLGAGTVTLNDGTINNSGLIDLQVGSLIQRSGTGGAISNSGTFRKSIGDGQTTLSLPFNNVDGTIEVQAGTLLNNVELTLDRGTYVIADGLALRSSALTNLVGNIESAPEGTLELTGSIVIAEGTSPTVNFSGDGLTVGGIANVTGGGVLINENILNITGASGKNISGGTTVQNEGTMNWLGNGTVTLNDGTINNSGLIDFQVSSLIQRSGAGGVIENTGILRKSQGATTSTISLPLKNQNGTIEVSEGTLTLNVELEMEEGTYSIAAGAILESTFLTRLIGNITSELEGTFNLSGNIQVDDGTLSALNFSGSGVNITGTSNIRGGGTLVNQDLLNFIGSAGKGIIEGTSIDNQGTLNWIGNGTVTLNDGVINNDGLIDLQASSLIQQTGVGGAINNKGTIVKSVDNVTSFSLPLINDSGTINLPTGTLAFNNSFDNGLEGRVQGMGTIDLPPTLLYTNQGIFAPGASPGTLNVSGAFEMEDEATIELELNGLTPDVEHDVLSISGNAFLTGNLDISVGFNPQVGDEFTVVNAGGSIDNCLFPATVTSNITTNFRYIFEVVCGTTSLTLRLTEIIELFPPVAENDTLTVENGGTATLNVTENDTDADGILDLSTFMLIDSTQHGYLTYDGMGSVTYTHNGSATNNDFFTYTITDNDGLASNIGRVEITILSDETPFEFEVEIFNAISPNGDNLNDYMQIENSDLLPNNRLIVFNRWGDRVFEISGYNNADRIFIGRSNLGSGGILPSGTYYYTFDPGDGRKEFTGFLTLKN